MSRTFALTADQSGVAVPIVVVAHPRTAAGEIAAGTYPLVVISHGNGGSGMIYRQLTAVARVIRHRHDVTVPTPEKQARAVDVVTDERVKAIVLPSQDPPGFDRERYHATLDAHVLACLQRVL